MMAGVLIFFYPALSDMWNRYHQSEAISNYSNAVSGMSDEENNKIINEALEYNRKVSERENKYTLSGDENNEYLGILSFSDDGIMGYIDIPKIEVHLPIYHTSEEKVLQKGVGHLEWTSLPVGGDDSHCVLSGHRGLPSSKLFSDLNLLEIGDMFYISVANEKLSYRVDQIITVLPEEPEALEISKGKDYVTLVTCTPYGVNSHRLLVRGERTEDNDSEEIVLTSEIKWIDRFTVAVMILPVFLLIGFLILWFADKYVSQ